MKASDIAYLISLAQKDCSIETPLIKELQEIYRAVQSPRHHGYYRIPISPDFPCVMYVETDSF